MKKIVFVAIMIFAFAEIHAQEAQKLSRKEKKALKETEAVQEIKEMLDSANFVFVPTQVLPLSMQAKTLDGTFSAVIKNDSIDSYLPFYGRAYRADYNSMQGPFTFNLPVKNYSLEKLKKEYLVQFDVRNNDDVVKFIFHIGETGYTTLNINSINRQSISYYGNIEKSKK